MTKNPSPPHHPTGHVPSGHADCVALIEEQGCTLLRIKHDERGVPHWHIKGPKGLVRPIPHTAQNPITAKRLQGYFQNEHHELVLDRYGLSLTGVQSKKRTDHLIVRCARGKSKTIEVVRGQTITEDHLRKAFKGSLPQASLGGAGA